MSIIQTTALLASLAASVSAHGYVQGIVADGTYYQGYDPSFQYQSTPPTVAGWSDPENLANGYVAPDAFADPDIICHLSATPGGTAAKVAAGGTVELQWNTWPESHHGPVLDYLAPVSGAWADIDKTSLQFFKISQGGLIDGSSAPGKWASDDLIANNNTWSVTIPTGVAPGKYVLRHEIIALHSAGQQNGAQNYPQCVNLEITGSGSDSPSGIPATEFYKADDAGILINIYTALGDSYVIPGPELYSGAASGGPKTGASAGTTAAASAISGATSGATSGAASSPSSPPYANTTAASTPATTPVAVPSSTYAAAPSAETTAYTTVDQTATATAVETAVAAPSSAVASAAPSEAPSSPASSAVPSSSTPTEDSAWGERPSKPLPSGYTLKDLEQWVVYLTKASWSEGDHARDFKRFRA